MLASQPVGDDWIIESAGTWATKGRPAHAQMSLAGAEVGLDLGHHRSRNVEDLPLSIYDLILTMEQSQKEALQIEFPAARAAVYQLTEMVGLRYDIADPIGGSIEDFRQTVAELKRLLKFGLPQITKLVTQRQEKNNTATDMPKTTP